MVCMWARRPRNQPRLGRATPDFAATQPSFTPLSESARTLTTVSYPCPCCQTGTPVEPLYGCCQECATIHSCHRCVSCGRWHHDHPATHRVVVMGADHLARCADGCRTRVTA